MFRREFFKYAILGLFSCKKEEMSLLNFFMSDSHGINIWVSGCSHCPADTTEPGNSRESIGIAIDQIDAGAFSFDAAVMLGDFDSNQNPPVVGDTVEGEDCSGQLNSSATFDRAKIYTMSGNHDCGDAEVDWFLRYIDPLGDNTAFSGVNAANMPYPQTLMEAGSWHSYYITIGNVRIIMLSDRNELPFPWGRGGSVISGGHPSGAITKDTWEWTKTLLADTSFNYIICTHANPRLTTIATPDGDRACGSHGTSGIEAGSGSLYSIYDEDIEENTDDATTQFLDYFNDNPNHTCVMWLGSHSHNKIGDACGTGSRTIKWTQHGVQFLNIANLTKYHGDQGGAKPIDPKSWLFNINNSRINCKMYLHMISDDSHPIGFYDPEEFNVNLKV